MTSVQISDPIDPNLYRYLNNGSTGTGASNAGNSGASNAGNSGASNAGNSGASTAGNSGASTAGNSGAADAGGAPDPSTGATPPAEDTQKVGTKSQMRRASATPNWGDKLGLPGGEWAKHDPVRLPWSLGRATYDSHHYLMENSAKWVSGHIPKSIPAGLVRGGLKALPIIGNLVSFGVGGGEPAHGHIVKGILGLVGAIPGPIGYLGMGAEVLYALLGPGDGTRYEMWAPPGRVDNEHETHMLPAAAGKDANVMIVDGYLKKAQDSVFGFQDGPDGTVWNSNAPDALRVDTHEVSTALDTWLNGISDQFDLIARELASSNEQYMHEALTTTLQPHLSAMKKITDYRTPITAQLKTASAAAGDWYSEVTGANKTARGQLNDGRTLTDDQGKKLSDAQNTHGEKITTANEALAKVAADKAQTLGSAGRVVPAPVDTGTPQLQPPAPLPTPMTPAPTTPVPTTPLTAPQDQKKDNSLGDALSALRNSMPAPGLGSGLGGMSPMGGLGGMPMSGMGGNPLGGQPLVTPPKQTPPLTPDAMKPKLATERPSLSAIPAENKVVPAAAKTDAVTGEKKSGTVVPPAAAAVPGTTTPGGKTGGDPTVKPAAAKPEDHTVDVKGKKITFPDGKTATLAKELSAGTPGAPASLADAANKAGLVPPVPGQDPGQQVAPADAKPGDLLRAGGKDYMLLGKGEFLDFSNGKVLSADTMPKDLGGNGGYFHLQDAGGAQATSPVSGQTPDTTAFAVDQHPKVPTDAGAAVPAASTATVPAGTPAVTPAATPAASTPDSSGGVTSSGSPGVPAATNGGGPANAASTDTGRGVGITSTSAKPLDPSAIK